MGFPSLHVPYVLIYIENRALSASRPRSWRTISLPQSGNTEGAESPPATTLIGLVHLGID